jgi:hypothetical protein
MTISQTAHVSANLEIDSDANGSTDFRINMVRPEEGRRP